VRTLDWRGKDQDLPHEGRGKTTGKKTNLERKQRGGERKIAPGWWKMYATEQPYSNPSTGIKSRALDKKRMLLLK